MERGELGPFKLVRQLAVGGMAEVYLAHTRGLSGFEKRLALKVIRPHFAQDENFVRMLVEEAKIVVQLNHSNIAQVFDLGQIDDTYYLTMEYVDGANLSDLQRRLREVRMEMPVEVAVHVASKVCAGLGYAHGKSDSDGGTLGIVHRDVSPQNIIVSQAGEVKIVESGIAKAALRMGQTRAGVIKGKYCYMSPEQAWGDPVDSRSDIFSTGVIFYEMLTGHPVYDDEDLERLLARVRQVDVEPPSAFRRDIPPQVDEIVMRALAREPQHRYATSWDFETALVKFLAKFAPGFGPAKLGELLRQLGLDGEPIAETGPLESMSREDVSGVIEHSVITSLPKRPLEEPDEPVLADAPDPETVTEVPRVTLDGAVVLDTRSQSLQDQTTPHTIRPITEPTVRAKAPRPRVEPTQISGPPAFESEAADEVAAAVASVKIPSSGDLVDDRAALYEELGRPSPGEEVEATLIDPMHIGGLEQIEQTPPQAPSASPATAGHGGIPASLMDTPVDESMDTPADDMTIITQEQGRRGRPWRTAVFLALGVGVVALLASLIF